VSIVPAPVGYLPPWQQDGAIGRLRRYSGLLALLSVLLTTGLIGLLIGHWTAPSKAPAAQVLKIEGGLPVAGAATAGSSTTAASTPASSAKTATSSSAAGEAQEVKEVKEAESPKAKAPPPVKTSSSNLKKLEKLTGKKHQQAIEKLVEGGKPIETGG
jgi:predicted lipid-binding transport protein (Tim44 family)